MQHRETQQEAESLFSARTRPGEAEILQSEQIIDYMTETSNICGFRIYEKCPSPHSFNYYALKSI